MLDEKKWIQIKLSSNIWTSGSACVFMYNRIVEKNNRPFAARGHMTRISMKNIMEQNTRNGKSNDQINKMEMFEALGV